MEYEKLHERYNELLRTHIDHVERTKFLMGAEMFDMAQSLPVNAKNDKWVKSIQMTFLLNHFGNIVICILFL
jgi:hypothetical protein